jgi:hypothetical protein
LVALNATTSHHNLFELSNRRYIHGNCGFGIFSYWWISIPCKCQKVVLNCVFCFFFFTHMLSVIHLWSMLPNSFVFKILQHTC